MTTSIRPPRQQRSRDGWERALTIATNLFTEGGYESLSVSEVCRQANISAPSLYARVDGREGLFRAVYERGMAELAQAEEHYLSTAGPSVEDVVSATVQIFLSKEAFLRAVIGRATSDADLLREGSGISRRLTAHIAEKLPGDRISADMTARVIYTECAFRVVYGDSFWNQAGESQDSFVSHLSLVCSRLLGGESE